MIALTLEQIAEFELPPAPTKKDDTRAADFIAKYGDMAVELDALPPDELQKLVRESVEQFVNKSAFDAERGVEAEEVEEVQRIIGRL